MAPDFITIGIITKRYRQNTSRIPGSTIFQTSRHGIAFMCNNNFCPGIHSMPFHVRCLIKPDSDLHYFVCNNCDHFTSIKATDNISNRIIRDLFPVQDILNKFRVYPDSTLSMVLCVYLLHIVNFSLYDVVYLLLESLLRYNRVTHKIYRNGNRRKRKASGKLQTWIRVMVQPFSQSTVTLQRIGKISCYCYTACLFCRCAIFFFCFEPIK